MGTRQVGHCRGKGSPQTQKHSSVEKVPTIVHKASAAGAAHVLSLVDGLSRQHPPHALRIEPVAVKRKLLGDVPQALTAAAQPLRSRDDCLVCLICDQLAAIAGAEPERRARAAAQSPAVRCLVCVSSSLPRPQRRDLGPIHNAERREARPDGVGDVAGRQACAIRANKEDRGRSIRSAVARLDLQPKSPTPLQSVRGSIEFHRRPSLARSSSTPHRSLARACPES